MVEITQEEFERLTNIEKEHNTLLETHNNLVAEHEELKGKHNTLKDDYIAICKGQHKGNDNTDDFDNYCSKKFGKK